MGDAPWQPTLEMFTGVMRGIQIYSSLLTLAEIAAEIATPLSTAAGIAGIWYLNMNPTPNDISDKSGQGHHPSWVGAGRPTLYQTVDSGAASKGNKHLVSTAPGRAGSLGFSR